MARRAARFPGIGASTVPRFDSVLQKWVLDVSSSLDFYVRASPNPGHSLVLEPVGEMGVAIWKPIAKQWPESPLLGRDANVQTSLHGPCQSCF